MTMSYSELVVEYKCEPPQCATTATALTLRSGETERMAKDQPIIKTCELCGVEISTVGMSAKDLERRRFCSNTCRHKTRRTHYLTREQSPDGDLYRLWLRIKNRCSDRAGKNYPDYAGRGITVDPSWEHDPLAFIAYVKVIMGARPDGMQIDRIDNNGNYAPGNIRWATLSENQRNKRSSVIISAFGQTMTCVEWAEKTGINAFLLYSRIRNPKWTPELALTVKPQPRRSQKIAYQGMEMNVTQWARKLGISKRTLRGRLDYGWTVERALTTPVNVAKNWHVSRKAQNG